MFDSTKRVHSMGIMLCINKQAYIWYYYRVQTVVDSRPDFLVFERVFPFRLSEAASLIIKCPFLK